MSNYIPRNFLVTGGAGFIGSNFVNYLLKAHPDAIVVVLDALTYAGNLESLNSVISSSKLQFVHGDIRDYNLVRNLLHDKSIDTLVNFAAESHVDRSIAGPDAFINTNIIGTHTLLKAAKSVWLDKSGGPVSHRFHHVSTDEVYGSLGIEDPAFTEVTPYSPNSPYAASKAASDHLVRAYHHTYGLQVTTSNCSNNYGPYQFPEKLIPLLIVNILYGKPLPVYGDGLNIRDWLYVEDHCRGIDIILKKGRIGETYNIGGDNEWTNINIVKLVCDLIDKAFENSNSLKERFPKAPAAVEKRSDTLIQYVEDRPGHDRRYAINSEKISAELGFCSNTLFETGIKKTIDWYLENESWWRNIIDGSYRESAAT